LDKLKKWLIKYEKCIHCGTIEIPHKKEMLLAEYVEKEKSLK
jgi:hypothetical protein